MSMTGRNRSNYHFIGNCKKVPVFVKHSIFFSSSEYSEFPPYSGQRMNTISYLSQFKCYSCTYCTYVMLHKYIIEFSNIGGKIKHQRSNIFANIKRSCFYVHPPFTRYTIVFSDLPELEMELFMVNYLIFTVSDRYHKRPGWAL